MNARDQTRELATRVRDRLRETDETLAVAETCTGGGVGAALTTPPGASDYLDRVLVPYDYDALRTLTGVDRETLDRHGAVSEAATAELARAARDLADVTWGVANTGVAGPGGGTGETPVGTAIIGVAYAAPWESGDSTTAVDQYRFDGDRQAVREQVVRQSLTDLLEAIKRER
ncbi:CinA family protein [Halapricum hydrolyticum]|uniref:Nicotinamide-nucleotide amidohydrolase family protein n=1 Tax=Halapricum hydrolyticum TaxID=2979991 RepID=A0AAE3LJD0_9EURY|nr:nicotinamide-nucleotide amidohydrolase family protein [Halapricum hydrolyticum]MCU4718023.1 nicotinamide-nucleotide amidohydrolase family protein [Halapricum hydrolyticum]MCU4727188.1 nicotinamide-nucleotide amidohydrolase family protein [Halapricum hydrolyticum]